MGQKANPKSLRICVTRQWPSKWFAIPRNYAKFVNQDIQIDKLIQKQFPLGTVSEVRINRQRNDTIIKIYAARPGVVIGRSGKGAEELCAFINKSIPGLNAKIDVFEVKRQEANAQAIAENVANQIERRISYRRAVKQAIERAKEKGVKGVRIRVSGRLNNVDIARSEVYSWGSIPSQTLKANIDFAVVHAKTATAGTVGVKVYVYE